MRLALWLGTCALAQLPLSAHAEAPDRCRTSEACEQYGRCTLQADRCVATSSSDCAASRACVEHGLRCELDAQARRCGSEPSDRLATEPRADGRAFTHAFGWINIVLGLGAAIATPIVLGAMDDDAMPELARVASYVSGIGGGIALVVTGSYLVSVSLERPVFALGNERLPAVFAAGRFTLTLEF